MAPKIKPADLDTTVFTIGTFLDANGKQSMDYSDTGVRASNEPKPFKSSENLKNEHLNAPSVGSSNKPKPSENHKDEHFVLRFNPLLFKLESEAKVKPEDVPAQKLNFLASRVGDNETIVYLPYKQKKITSTEIPLSDKAVCYFITSRMSGCNFYIDKLRDESLIFYHANALQDSETEKDKKASLAAAQIAMDKQHSAAQKSGATNLVTLRRAEYYAKAIKWVEDNDKINGRTKSEFVGGATVMGFRVAGQWEFWFQTSGKLTYQETSSSGFLNLRKAKLEVETPSKIVGKSTRFWPK